MPKVCECWGDPVLEMDLLHLHVWPGRAGPDYGSVGTQASDLVCSNELTRLWIDPDGVEEAWLPRGSCRAGV